MDSMRSLNTSLPTPNSSHPAPPEQLLQAFRMAALSVTNLYKSAVTGQSESRQQGYQDALDDLLSFLDRENLGLQDGEGWKIRQWATERYDGTTSHQQHTSESDDERSDTGRRPSPPTEPVEVPSQPEQVHEEIKGRHSPPEQDTLQPPGQPPIFTFSGGDEVADDMQTDDRPTSPEEILTPSSSTTSAVAPIRVEVLNRGPRSTPRQVGLRQNVRSNPSNREFTFTAGTKRKVQFPDFFDISNIGPREGSSGSKRGRFA